ncbi:MAG: Lrp/AsnC family transcriptional regulator [Candidatus Njordarchaeia archaeon]
MKKVNSVRKKISNALDNIDQKILNILQVDANKSLDEMSKELKMSKSAIHYRIKKMQEKGIIRKFMALVDPVKVGCDILAISLIRAKFGPGYQKKVGEKLSKIKGIWGVYFLLGDIDFVVLIRAKNRDDLQRIINEFINTPEIERSSTHIILETIKEDPIVEFEEG